jgi:PKD repeat protein
MTQRLAKLSPSLLACGAVLLYACTTRDIEIRELRVELMNPYAPAAALVVGKVTVPQAVGGNKLTATVNFGDGSSSADVDLDSEGHFSVKHDFNTAGSFDVLVEAKSGNTAKGSSSIRADIYQPLGGLAVTCRLCDNAGGCQEASDCTVPGPAVTLSVTSQGGFNATRYTWNFGDVTPPMDGQVVTHEYRQSGTYRVTVVASDTLSSQSAFSTDVNVEGIAPVEVSTGVATFADNNAHAPNDVAQLAINANGVPPLTLLVTWGDESNNVYPSYAGDGSTFRATHTYLLQGTYTATVTAVDRLGNQNSTTRNFTVLEPLPDAGMPDSGN